MNDGLQLSPGVRRGIVDFRPATLTALPTGLRLLQFAPSPALRAHVQCFWYARRIDADASGANVSELMHPDGGMGLLFNFGGPVSRDDGVAAKAAWVDGPKLRTARLRAGRDLDLLGVRFRTGSGALIVGKPLNELAGATPIPSDDLRHLALEALHERLWQTPDLTSRIAMLESFLLERLRHAEAMPAVVPASLAWLRQRALQGEGAASIATLVDELPVGQRRLERLFQRHVGLTPKRYARLLRIARSRELIKQGGRRVALTDTAYAAGYYDQAHFIHDFKAVTGMTPGGYREHVQRRYGHGVQP
ncbi:helix-turn-helix domain-containing protein [Chromohalobacter israelensis]|uniref:helix-turn-helix domain-containing protein n=1 Tax=Chromohalobacter israelensis TaxID=141390 RepID=UPI001D840CCA|nr:AraC family transcriptional regulator [Chromohalobacter salexigens]